MFPKLYQKAIEPDTHISNKLYEIIIIVSFHKIHSESEELRTVTI